MFVEAVGFISDVKSLIELKKLVSQNRNAWDETIAGIKKIIKESCKEFNDSLSASHEHKALVIGKEYIDELVNSVGGVVSERELITIDIILPNCPEISAGIKKQLFNKIHTDLMNNSQAYEKLVGLHKIEKIDTTTTKIDKTTEKISDDIQDLKKIILELPTAPPEEKHLPSSFPRLNIVTVGREKDIRAIHSMFEKKNIIALCGEGGIGKTVTAELYAESQGDEYKTVNYLQFSESALDTLIELGNEWGLPGFNDLTREQKWETVKSTLKNVNYKVLIVIDINNDSITQISDYINLGSNKKIKFLFTTRVKELPPCNMIEIEPLSDDEVKQVFISNAGDKQNRAFIEKEIAEHAEQYNEIIEIYSKNTMLTALAARIKNVANKSITELCEMIKHNSLLSAEKIGIPIIKDDVLPVKLPLDEHIKNLFNIANLTKEQVSFLRNMSLIDYSGVPLEKFNEWTELTNNITENSLENNGFIHYRLNSDNKKIIFMHPAVSDTVFEQTGANSVSCLDFLVQIYNNEYDPTYLHNKRYLIAIAEFICERIESEETLPTCKFLSFSGALQKRFSNYKKALYYYVKAQELTEKVEGPYHPDTSTSYNNVGSVYNALGDNEKALEFYWKANKMVQAVFGAYNLHTAHSYNNIATIYQEMGKLEDALDYHGKALQIKKMVVGDYHLDTAISYNNIGCLYHKTGEIAEAIEFCGKALEIYRKILGDGHPETASSYTNIGNIYSSLGEYDIALEYYNNALNIYENVFGRDHQNTATLYNNIGTLYCNLLEFEKALDCYNKSLMIREKVLGTDHPDTMNSYNNIGDVYYKLAEYNKALHYYIKALEIKEKVLGTEHLDTAKLYNNIGMMHSKLNEHEKALEYLIKALHIVEKVLGPHHSNTIEIYMNIVACYDAMSDVKKAFEYFQKYAQAKAARDKNLSEA
jgi:tetratricopeptide (TPR) repeat protein